MASNTPVLLTDHRFDLIPGGADDGAYTAGIPTVDDFLIDLATFMTRRELMDTSEGQSEQEHYRVTGNDFEVTFETTLDCGSMLRDLAVTLYPGGADDLGYSAGTGLTTLKFDEVVFTQTNTLTNKCAKQSPWPTYRLDKKPWNLSLKKKKSTTGSTGAENLLVSNALVGFNLVHAPADQTIEIDGHGIVEEWSTNYGGSEDLGWNIKPYGAAPTITADDANSLVSLLIGNELVRAKLLNDVTNTALDVDVTGIIATIELTFRPDKNTIRFTIKPYGVAPTLNFA